MTGASFQIELAGIDKVDAVFKSLGNPDLRPLLDALGAEGESQTRRRIEEEKTAPDGAPWAPWSERYAKTRNSGQSLLQSEGDLLDSISYQVIGGDEVEWGSNLVYAAIHQFGSDDMPERPYLGLSAENEADMDAIMTDWAEDLLQ